MARMPGATHYRTIPRGTFSAHLEEKRSTFLALLTRVETLDEARAHVDAARAGHADARHHCSAFVLGPDGHTHGSHDGEPSGTAGRPMLDVLQGSGLCDVAVVVVRWFGGTLLGAGGLVRAYSGVTAAALATTPVVGRERRAVWAVTLPHALAGQIEHALRVADVEVGGHDWSRPDGVRLALTVPPGAEERVRAVLAEASAGSVAADPVGSTWVDLLTV